jgi:DNA-binding transcriptional MerR regulator
MNLPAGKNSFQEVSDVPMAALSGAELSISEMVRLFDTTERTLRFYETRGLLAPPRRGQVRRYDLESRRRFRLILEGRRLGFSLTQIAEMLATTGDDEFRFTEERLRGHIEMLEEKHRNIEAALADLRKRYYLMREVREEADEPPLDSEAVRQDQG